MTDCTHVKLVKLVGPIHEKDNPPQYICSQCREIFNVVLSEPTIGVSFGKPTT